VAIWPDDAGILNSDHIAPSGSDWYSLLADFLARP
jgi:hypothetical protein